MTKKNFEIQKAEDTFFPDKTYNTQDKSNKQEKHRGRPPKSEKLRGYRYNLNLDNDLKDFLHEIAWQKRTSITQYINDLIRSDMKEFLAKGGKVEI